MKKKTPEEKTREALYAAQEKLNKAKSRPIFRKVILISLIVIAVAALIWIAAASIKVDTINVSGDLSAYNETRVAEASGISIGKSIFSSSAFKIKRNIRENIPLADKIKVRKNIFTGQVNIEITFLPFDYYIEYKNRYYAVDEELTVVDIRDSENDFSSLGARLLVIPKICQPVFGEQLVFYDTVENPDGDENFDGSFVTEIKDKSAYDYVFDVVRELRASKDYSSLTKIDLTQKFSVTGVYKNAFKVDFGSVANFELKLMVLSDVLADTSWQHSGFGVIDIKDPSAATARSVQSIDDDEAANDDKTGKPDDKADGGIFS